MVSVVTVASVVSVVTVLSVVAVVTVVSVVNLLFTIETLVLDGFGEFRLKLFGIAANVCRIVAQFFCFFKPLKCPSQQEFSRNNYPLVDDHEEDKI